MSVSVRHMYPTSNPTSPVVPKSTMSIPVYAFELNSQERRRAWRVSPTWLRPPVAASERTEPVQ
jgi:hypothetical protein